MSENTPYLCKTLPIQSEMVTKLIKNCWHANEAIWQGPIPKEQLLFADKGETYNDFSVYFKKKKYSIPVDQVPGWDKGFDNDLENWPKIVWLAKEYFSVGFRNPMGGHYNPRIRKNVIHPGGCRQKIIDFFATGTVDLIYFNTGGIRPKWLSNLSKRRPKDLFDEGYAIHLVADHGSLIPHVMKDLGLIPHGKKKTHFEIQKMLSNLHVNSPNDLDVLEPWRAKKSAEANWEVTYDPNNPERNLVKSMTCVMAGVEYTDQDVEVKKIK